MTWKEATDALLAHFKARWAAIHPTVPIHFPNAKPLSADSQAGAWVRIRFLPSFSNRIVLGGQTRAQGGVLVVNTFSPLAQGDGVSATYQRELEQIYEQAHATGLSGEIHLSAPSPVPAIQDPDLPLYRGGISVSFHFEHTP